MNERAPLRFLATAFIVTATVFLAVYSRSFDVLPASDDWPIVNEIHRGTYEGVGVFFTESVIQIGYRPLKSVVIWACGQLGDTVEQQMVWVRFAHLLSVIFYAAVAALWVRAMPVGRIGAATVLAVMLLHPVLPAAAGSVDGIDTPASSALLWLGAWCILYFRDRPAVAIPTALACFVVGVGFKENTFALVPLGVIVVLAFWRKRPLVHAVIVGAALAVVAAGLILIRQSVIRDGLSAGQEMIRFHPVQIAENAALFATGLLFFGNSMWAFVNRSPAVLAIAGLSCLAAFVLIVGGIMLRLTQTAAVRDPAPDAAPTLRTDPSLERWLVFVFLGLVTASFPTILLYHVSEMYVPPMLLPFALLCGIAADGLARARRPVRAVAATAAAVALVTSVAAIRVKVDGLVDVGLRARHQLQQLIAFLPPDARDKTVGIRFLASDQTPRDLYSVFRMPDSLLLVHRCVLNFALPYRGIELDADIIEDYSQVDPSEFDLALGWNPAEQRFFALPR